MPYIKDVDLPRHASDTPSFLLIVSPTLSVQSVCQSRDNQTKRGWPLGVPPHLKAPFTRHSLSLFQEYAVPKDSTPVKFTYICQFEQGGVNAGMFEKTRIRFNSYVFTTLAIVIFKVPCIHERDASILDLPQTLMIEGGKVSWFAVGRIWPNRDVFLLLLLCFGFTHSLEERLTSFSKWTQKGDMYFVTSLHVQ